MLIPSSLRLTSQFRLSASQCRRFNSSLKILYFGTDNFSLPSLKRLSHETLSRLEVVTSFKARNNPVKAFAESKGIKIYDWAHLRKQENYEICREFDLGLVVSFGHLIPESIINSFKYGMLNVHASLLPKYRGASPIIYAIKNGDTETGVSIMRIKPNKFDVGEVLATQKLSISDDVLMPQLHDELASAGAELLIECVKDLNSYQPMKQDESKASYAPKVDNEFCKVRWNEMTSRQVFNLHRAIYSFKHIITSFNSESVKLIDIARHQSLDENRQACQPGDLRFCKKSKKLLVMCADENFIEINQLSIGKKKTMSSVDFNNGFLKKCNVIDRKFL